MAKIKRALISVSDKSGIVELAQELAKFGVEIISTGGTAKLLKNSGVNVKEISEHTGFPEMLDGRVKTLHPKIHGGLLALRDNPEHLKQIKEHNIEPIDMVVVNLYPFEATIKKPGVTLEEAIENIDIGGPSMLRSAAKNYRSVAVVSDAKYYSRIIQELKQNQGAISDGLLKELGLNVFKLTSYYDGKIYEYLSRQLAQGKADELFPKEINLKFSKIQDLRYGENPHQKAALYKDPQVLDESLANAQKLSGKELSFNNFLDLNAAWGIVREFDEPAAVVIKHLNPTGVAIAKDIKTAYLKAWSADKLSAFGGIVGLNKKVDLDTAKKINTSGFLECVIAPDYDKDALELLIQKKNFRVLKLKLNKPKQGLDIKSIDGGVVIQENDLLDLDKDKLKVVTKRKPTQKEWKDLLFGWKVVKHVKSNAIVFAKNLQTVGVGMGQINRVDSVMLCAKRAGKNSKGSVLASDAFFPKEDNIKLAAKAKVKAIIQPGGSIADEAVIKEADKHGIAMVFTGCRHFKH
ncbi:MAG: bifunctional phosphoribosylaminoimidazolecarboxamide formyltransferase/IMP cyclohydrolase [Candidatus Omnitrophica bacterium]|nr:bifunctional phosphoribosylaminoimidazolecarboxamide formyltransferase/IMP cyclohydrolase [Candidatus Omnitrophota bacterium]MDD5351683.1 bifunctional phosphoribosylaminoimidazolecarboxamide formyltransferase/IMP cyclohydrolase [Candidatus Omnitrophota bacterium]MDD5550893.1 bifunctional phosphoribosylaminoimidazolecarboxamide formyltransferase/IMP cyclohydrolase [Candidatus Omnitrophota bacterium]